MSLERRPRGRIREGLREGVLEGLVAGGMFAVTEAWLVPLLVQVLGAGAAAIGLLTIIPQIAGIGLGPWSQTVISWLGGNKRATLVVSISQIVCLALLSVPLHAAGTSWSIPLALCLIIAFGITGAVGGPAWIAWMGGLIPRSLQGRYTGTRNRVFHCSRLLCAGIFAGVASLLPLGASPWGMQIILIAAVISRIASVYYLARQADLPPRPSLSGPVSQRLAPEHGGFMGFVRSMTVSDLGRWTLVWAMLHFGVMIAAPFFTPYMLASVSAGGLGLDSSPFLYTCLIYTSTISRLVTYPAAGKLVDLHGPAAILRVSVLIITIIPLGWLLTSNLWLIIAFEIISGVGWCLAEIAVGPLLFSCHRDPQQRAILIGRHQSVVMIAVVLGSGIGTVLIGSSWLPPMTGSTFHTLFLISMLARIPAVFLALRLLPKLRDLPTDRDGHGELWRLIPGAGLTVTVGRGLGGFFRRTEGE